jgi:hypothetical protein
MRGCVPNPTTGFPQLRRRSGSCASSMRILLAAHGRIS